MEKDTYKNENTYRITERKETQSPLAITVDVHKYEHFLENADLTEEQKQEFLQTLWNIICEFVSLGFGVHPLQQIEQGCGKDSVNEKHESVLTPDMLNSFHQHLSSDLKDNAALEKERQEEGVEV